MFFCWFTATPGHREQLSGESSRRTLGKRTRVVEHHLGAAALHNDVLPWLHHQTLRSRLVGQFLSTLKNILKHIPRRILRRGAILFKPFGYRKNVLPVKKKKELSWPLWSTSMLRYASQKKMVSPLLWSKQTWPVVFPPIVSVRGMLYISCCDLCFCVFCKVPRTLLLLNILFFSILDPRLWAYERDFVDLVLPRSILGFF